MHFVAYLKTFIYLVSSSLFYPVLLILALMVVGMIVYSGGFFAEWLHRARLPEYDDRELPDLLDDPDRRKSVMAAPARAYEEQLAHMLDNGNAEPIRVENVLQTHTSNIEKALDHLMLLVRVAPGCGLIGTLIPMGTGLAALGQGDMSTLTSDLVIAFTTTVVGLGVGLLAFFFYTIKRRWVEDDIRKMELLTEIMAGEGGKGAAS
ncbi:MAG: MotA/TolQ/ExbB proton channel family protein [Planctomycetota bacterium]